jgi:hypothetical protein
MRNHSRNTWVATCKTVQNSHILYGGITERASGSCHFFVLRVPPRSRRLWERGRRPRITISRKRNPVLLDVALVLPKVEFRSFHFFPEGCASKRSRYISQCDHSGYSSKHGCQNHFSFPCPLRDSRWRRSECHSPVGKNNRNRHTGQRRGVLWRHVALGPSQLSVSDTAIGIPYAEPPVGSLRLKQPVLKKSLSSSTFNATSYGLPCLQRPDVGPVSAAPTCTDMWTDESRSPASKLRRLPNHQYLQACRSNCERLSPRHGIHSRRRTRRLVS